MVLWRGDWRCNPWLGEKRDLDQSMVADPVRYFQPLELKFFFNVPLNLKSVSWCFQLRWVARLKRAAQIFGTSARKETLRLKNCKAQAAVCGALDPSLLLDFTSENWIQWNVRLKKYRCQTRISLIPKTFYSVKKRIINSPSTLDVRHRVVNGRGTLVIKTRPENIAKHHAWVFRTSKNGRLIRSCFGHKKSQLRKLAFLVLPSGKILMKLDLWN